jgi:hypothetical protein
MVVSRTHRGAAKRAVCWLRLIASVWLFAFLTGAAAHDHTAADHQAHFGGCILCSAPSQGEDDGLLPDWPSPLAAEGGFLENKSVLRVLAAHVLQRAYLPPLRGPPPVS